MSTRTRPENGGIVWHDRAHAFECLGCGEIVEMRRRAEYENPEHVATMRELLVVDHTECWEYADPRMARLQRRFRKEAKRQKNLAAQSGAWRGMP